MSTVRGDEDEKKEMYHSARRFAPPLLFPSTLDRSSMPSSLSGKSKVNETLCYIDLEDGVQQTTACRGSYTHAEKPTKEKDSTMPLIDEVTFIGAGNFKNAKRLWKVKEAESYGVSKSLKNLVLSKNASSKKHIEESFAILERNTIEINIIQGLCANGIPFNVVFYSVAYRRNQSTAPLFPARITTTIQTPRRHCFLPQKDPQVSLNGALLTRTSLIKVQNPIILQASYRVSASGMSV
ncbi:hypothetical protein L1887_03384 [Cichorium endivia]|nr:hypothetical protein L1887_03384 [Cichorium endivia]